MPDGPDSHIAGTATKRITDAAESIRGADSPPAVVMIRAHALSAYISFGKYYTVADHNDAIVELCDAAEAAAEVARAGLASRVVIEVGVALRDVARRMSIDLSAYTWLEPLLSGVGDAEAHWDVSSSIFLTAENTDVVEKQHIPPAIGFSEVTKQTMLRYLDAEQLWRTGASTAGKVDPNTQRDLTAGLNKLFL